jgi:hypothetical protein
MATTCAARIHPINRANLVEIEKRVAARKSCLIEATSRPIEVGDGMAWGGTVRDISAGGLKLAICFPFSPSTFLAVEMQSAADTVSRALVCRVVHVHDHADGTWTLGCEFIKPLSDSEIELLA